MTILDRIAQSAGRRWQSQFRPVTTLEYFGLRLATHLGEPAASRHYVELAEHHSEAVLIAALHRLDGHDARSLDAGQFHEILRRNPAIHARMPPSQRLLAIRIERRTIATVLMTGDQIEHEPVRHLSSDPAKAAESAAVFINRLCDRFGIESAALEDVPRSAEVQRLQLHRIISSVLTDRGVSVWTVSKREVFAAFGHPPLRSRRELREVIDRVFPWLNGGYGAPLVRDAAALGLYCQTERHFLN